MSRMKIVAVVVAVAGMAAACKSESQRETDEQGRPAPTMKVEGDNTARNVRDRSDTAATADRAVHSGADLGLTQRIRQAVIADDSLSTTGHNVKILVNDGKVTLKGPVASAAERDKILAMAVRIAGADMVDNQMEVAP